MSETEITDISEIGERVLRALAQYRFLTVKQMLTLGVGRDKGHLHHVLANLLSVRTKGGAIERRPKEIGELDFGVKVGKGRLARLYYLTKRGAEQLEMLDAALAPIPYPPRITKFASDYEHRVRCVDFHIALTQWCTPNDQRLAWSRWYFHWATGSAAGKPMPVTQITLKGRNIVPDGLFMLTADDGTERLFAFEMANGRDTGRVVQQIESYCRALSEDAINRTFKYENAVRVLFVFEHQRHLELVRERASRISVVRDHYPFFFLKPFVEIDPVYLKDNWRRIDTSDLRDPLY